MLYFQRIRKTDDYREAIAISCGVLEKNGSVKPGYYDAIMDTIAEFGGYFYLGEGICMPHANAPQLVREAGICVLVLEKETNFLGHSVSMFITLAADNSGVHRELLQKVARACQDADRRERMMQARSAGDISGILAE